MSVAVPPRLGLTPVEAAEAIGCGKTLVYSLIKSGELPAVRVGVKRWVIPVRALEDYLVRASTRGA